MAGNNNNRPGGGGADAGGNRLTGELGFTPRAARTRYHGLADGGWGLSFVSVTMASDPVDTCSRNLVLTQPLHAVALQVGMPWPDGGIVTSGTYVVDNMSAALSSGGVQALRVTVLPDGGYVDFYGQATGSITFSQVDTTRARGTFAVEFSLQDGGTSPLSGSFDAPACEP